MNSRGLSVGDRITIFLTVIGLIFTAWQIYQEETRVESEPQAELHTTGQSGGQAVLLPVTNQSDGINIGVVSSEGQTGGQTAGVITNNFLGYPERHLNASFERVLLDYVVPKCPNSVTVVASAGCAECTSYANELLNFLARHVSVQGVNEAMYFGQKPSIDVTLNVDTCELTVWALTEVQK